MIKLRTCKSKFQGISDRVRPVRTFLVRPAGIVKSGNRQIAHRPAVTAVGDVPRSVVYDDCAPTHLRVRAGGDSEKVECRVEVVPRVHCVRNSVFPWCERPRVVLSLTGLYLVFPVVQLYTIVLAPARNTCSDSDARSYTYASVSADGK